MFDKLFFWLRFGFFPPVRGEHSVVIDRCEEKVKIWLSLLWREANASEKEIAKGSNPRRARELAALAAKAKKAAESDTDLVEKCGFVVRRNHGQEVERVEFAPLANYPHRGTAARR
ncbi:MAG: hypothetical protein COV31_02820 [Candidatus Yanofskybacteria bacterium CG10_big_fil_rev_8_21_14_0_10_46_23]|uniref:Uncharacterized protein n=1 Tax=Candidatus Yanofskybacteria bacterium CG10_big_fil_rev_8_21_14_0_10_46_23 TaxID=1975098 RepID=A0A2H0R3R3_9BACT|nr:MAG: hypothetical protein COV31_02820 [Candidatus Yanofskybacteria bacterium CG10_big_fil_rev_8_21_14_0_10_46_23]